MSYRAIYAYAWDLIEEGVSKSVGQFRALGLDTVTLAGAYHAGKFLRPHGRTGKVYFPEDGTIYFKPSDGFYGAIKPIVNTQVAEHDVFGALVKRTDIAVNAWMVLLHNTPLGMRHPEACVENAFGDRYVYSLCPSKPAVRDYSIALCADITNHYSVSGLSLESPGFAPYAHGYHHEFALNRPNRWLDNLLGLCFCEDCRNGAKRKGIDADALKARIAKDIADYLAADLDFSTDMAEAFWHADTQADGALRAFLDHRCAVVTSLVTEIRARIRQGTTLAVIPSVARPTAGAWYEGSDLPALAKAGCTIEACFYEPGSTRVKADLFDIRRRIGEAPLRGILRPAFPDFESKLEFLAAVAALRDGGVTDLAFYNWGHLRQRNIAWIGEALAFLEAA